MDAAETHFPRTPDADAGSSVDMHPADVIALLHKAGLSLRHLEEQHGLKLHTLNTALRRSSYPSGERLIAAALGKPVTAIWPARVARRAARAKAK